MGLTRKSLSIFTIGAVDFRSDKERMAAHAKGTKHAVKRQTKAIKRGNRVTITQALASIPLNAPQEPVMVPLGGWHPDPWGLATLRWWDGQKWTHHTHG